MFNFPNFISNSHTVFDGNPVLENPTPLSWIVFAILLIGAIIWLAKSKIKPEKKHFPCNQKKGQQNAQNIDETLSFMDEQGNIEKIWAGLDRRI